MENYANNTNVNNNNTEINTNEDVFSLDTFNLQMFAEEEDVFGASIVNADNSLSFDMQRFDDTVKARLSFIDGKAVIQSQSAPSVFLSETATLLRNSGSVTNSSTFVSSTGMTGTWSVTDTGKSDGLSAVQSETYKNYGTSTTTLNGNTVSYTRIALASTQVHAEYPGGSLEKATEMDIAYSHVSYNNAYVGLQFDNSLTGASSDTVIGTIMGRGSDISAAYTAMTTDSSTSINSDTKHRFFSGFNNDSNQENLKVQWQYYGTNKASMLGKSQWVAVQFIGTDTSGNNVTVGETKYYLVDFYDAHPDDASSEVTKDMWDGSNNYRFWSMNAASATNLVFTSDTELILNNTSGTTKINGVTFTIDGAGTTIDNSGTIITGSDEDSATYSESSVVVLADGKFGEVDLDSNVKLTASINNGSTVTFSSVTYKANAAEVGLTFQYDSYTGSTSAVINSNMDVVATEAGAAGVFQLSTSSSSVNATLLVDSNDTVTFAGVDTTTFVVKSGSISFNIADGKYQIASLNEGDSFTINKNETAVMAESGEEAGGDIAEDYNGDVVEAGGGNSVGSSVTYTKTAAGLVATDGTDTWLIQMSGDSIDYGDIAEPAAGSMVALIELNPSSTTFKIGVGDGEYVLGSGTLTAWVVGSSTETNSSTFYAKLTNEEGAGYEASGTYTLELGGSETGYGTADNLSSVEIKWSLDTDTFTASLDSVTYSNTGSATSVVFGISGTAVSSVTIAEGSVGIEGTPGSATAAAFASGVTMSNAAIVASGITYSDATDAESTTKFAFTFAKDAISSGTVQSGALLVTGATKDLDLDDGIALNAEASLIFSGTSTTHITSLANANSTTKLTITGNDKELTFNNISEGTVFTVESNTDISGTYIHRSSVGLVKVSDDIARIYVDNPVDKGSVDASALKLSNGNTEFEKIVAYVSNTSYVTITVSDVASAATTSYAGIAFADATDSTVSKVYAVFQTDNPGKTTGSYTIGYGAAGTETASTATINSVIFDSATLLAGTNNELTSYITGNLIFSNTVAENVFVVNGDSYSVASSGTLVLSSYAGTDSKLVSGILNMNQTYDSVTIEVGSTTFQIGDNLNDAIVIEVTSDDGLVAVSGVDVGESFTYDGYVYEFKDNTGSFMKHATTDTSRYSLYNAGAVGNGVFIMSDLTLWDNIAAHRAYVIDNSVITDAALANTQVWFTANGNLSQDDEVNYATFTRVGNKGSVYTLYRTDAGTATGVTTDITIDSDVSAIELTPDFAAKITTQNTGAALTIGDTTYTADSSELVILTYLKEGEDVASNSKIVSGNIQVTSNGDSYTASDGTIVTASKKGTFIGFSDGKVTSFDLGDVTRGTSSVEIQSTATSSVASTDTYVLAKNATYLYKTHDQADTANGYTAISFVSDITQYVSIDESRTWLGLAENATNNTSNAVKNGITFTKNDLSSASTTGMAYAVVNNTTTSISDVYASVAHGSSETLTDVYTVNAESSWSGAGITKVNVTGTAANTPLNMKFNLANAVIEASNTQVLNINGTSYLSAASGTSEASGTLTFSTTAAGDASLYTGDVYASGTTYSSVTVADDTVTWTAGDGVIVQASNGTITKISELDSGAEADVFTFNGKTYTDADLGLVTYDGTNYLLNTVATGTSVNVSDLTDSNLKVIAAASDGAIVISALIASDTIYTNAVDGTASKTYAVATLTDDGNIQFSSTTSDVTKLSIYNTATLGTSGVTLTSDTVTGNSELKITTLVERSGSAAGIDIGFTNGSATAVSGVDVGESFYYGGKEYIESKVGLIFKESDSATYLHSSTSPAADGNDATYTLTNIASTNTSIESITKVESASTEIVLSTATASANLTYLDALDATASGIIAQVAYNTLTSGAAITTSNRPDQIKVVGTIATINGYFAGAAGGNSDITITSSGSEGGIVASIVSGGTQIEKMSGLEAGDQITYSGTSYTMSVLGLISNANANTATLVQDTAIASDSTTGSVTLANIGTTNLITVADTATAISITSTYNVC